MAQQHLFRLIITHRGGRRQLEKVVLAANAEEAREQESGTLAMFAPRFSVTSVEAVPAEELRAVLDRLVEIRDRRRANRL